MIGILAMVMTLQPADPPHPRTVAMVLDLKGRVELRPAVGEARPAKIEDLLYPGDRLAIPADGAATLAFLGVGAQERLAAGTEATIGREGCTPKSAVAGRKDQRQAVAQTMKGVRALPGDGRKAAGILRAVVLHPPAITPIQRAKVATDRPDFAWPPAKGAKRYRFKLLSGDDRELWRAEATGPTLAYPAGKAALTRGYLYRWEVTDSDSRPVVTGDFLVADESERMQMEELKPLAAGDDRADVLAAGLSFRRLGCYAEAIVAFERLAKLAPDEPVYREELAELCQQAGRSEVVKEEAPGDKSKGE